MRIDKLNQIFAIVGNIDRTGKVAELILKIRAGVDDDGAVVGDSGFDVDTANGFILSGDLGLVFGRGER